MTGMSVHNCSTCALKRVPLENIKIDDEDIKVYSRIQVMLANTVQAADPSILKNLPEDISQEDKALYMEKALKNKNDAHALLSEWWRVMMEKYGLSNLAMKIDEERGYFYYCEDSNGNPSLDGAYVPKGNGSSSVCTTCAKCQ